MAGRNQHVYLVHAICRSEIDNLQQNISDFVQNSGDMLNIILSNSDQQGSNPLWLIAIEDFLSKMTSVTDMCRKVNLRLALNDMTAKESKLGALLKHLSVNDQHEPQPNIPCDEIDFEKEVELYREILPNNLSDVPSLSPNTAPKDHLGEILEKYKTEFMNKTTSQDNNYSNDSKSNNAIPSITNEASCSIENLDQKYSTSIHQSISVTIPDEKQEISLNKNEIQETSSCENSVKTRSKIKDLISPIRDLKHFKKNTEFKASITYITDDEKLRFFIAAFQFYPKSRKLLQLQKLWKTLTSYDNLPPEGEVFGLLIDNVLYRAVRGMNGFYTNISEPKDNLALLLEYGEMVEITKNYKMYQIPKEFKKLPAQAIECYLHSINGHVFSNMLDVLHQYALEKVQFSVVENTGNTLYLNLLEENYIQHKSEDELVPIIENFETNVRLSEENLKQLQTEEQITKVDSTNPFIHSSNDDASTIVESDGTLDFWESAESSFSWPKSDQEDMEIECISNQTKQTSNDKSEFPLNKSYQKDHYVEPKCSLNIKSPFSLTKEDQENLYESPSCSFNVKSDQEKQSSLFSFTKEELESLYEEPECTTNALKAVLGYAPKDDARYCKFYNEQTKSCFKGSNCKLEHEPIIKEGWTKDQMIAGTDAPLKTTFYSENTIVSILPTQIGSIEYFYAQIITNNDDPPYIWNSSDITESLKLNRPPYVYDIVLAQYKDDLWYRAKVIEIIGNRYKLFYVDYGNYEIVPIQRLAKCNQFFINQPFQAHRCRIVDIKDVSKNAEKSQAGIEMLSLMILNQKIKVEILSNKDELMIVKFVDENFLEVPNVLISNGFAKTSITII